VRGEIACASLILARAPLQFFFCTASCAALSGTPTLALTFCCASATDGASSADVTATAPVNANATLSTQFAFVFIPACLVTTGTRAPACKKPPGPESPGSLLLTRTARQSRHAPVT